MQQLSWTNTHDAAIEIYTENSDYKRMENNNGYGRATLQINHEYYNRMTPPFGFRRASEPGVRACIYVPIGHHIRNKFVVNAKKLYENEIV